MTPEGRIKATVKKRLDELGAYHYWPVPMGLGAATLDCLGFYRGMGFAIETKAPGKKLTTRQKITAEKIADAGGVVFIVDSKEKADAIALDLYSCIKAKPPPAGALRQD